MNGSSFRAEVTEASWKPPAESNLIQLSVPGAFRSVAFLSPALKGFLIRLFLCLSHVGLLNLAFHQSLVTHTPLIHFPYHRLL